MRSPLALCFGLLSLAAWFAAPTAPAQDGFDSALAGDENTLSWHTNLDDAIEEARQTGKPILLEFRCAP